MGLSSMVANLMNPAELKIEAAQHFYLFLLSLSLPFFHI